MLYLIGQGMDPALSFKIMESVRKGKVAKGKEGSWPAWKKEMEEHGVPEWYLGSAEKIQYMFPKAHAAAYVMMALRVAYCKLYYPLEYYTAYFSIRADGFDYEMMATGRENMTRNLAMLRKNKDSLSDKELLVLRDMRLVEEMYARGIEFMPIDVYKAKADRFQIIDGKIMPSFNSIGGRAEPGRSRRAGTVPVPRGHDPALEDQFDPGGDHGAHGHPGRHGREQPAVPDGHRAGISCAKNGRLRASV